MIDLAVIIPFFCGYFNRKSFAAAVRHLQVEQIEDLRQCRDSNPRNGSAARFVPSATIRIKEASDSKDSRQQKNRQPQKRSPDFWSECHLMVSCRCLSVNTREQLIRHYHQHKHRII